MCEWCKWWDTSVSSLPGRSTQASGNSANARKQNIYNGVTHMYERTGSCAIANAACQPQKTAVTAVVMTQTATWRAWSNISYPNYVSFTGRHFFESRIDRFVSAFYRPFVKRRLLLHSSFFFRSNKQLCRVPQNNYISSALLPLAKMTETSHWTSPGVQSGHRYRDRNGPISVSIAMERKVSLFLHWSEIKFSK